MYTSYILTMTHYLLLRCCCYVMIFLAIYRHSILLSISLRLQLSQLNNFRYYLKHTLDTFLCCCIYFLDFIFQSTIFQYCFTVLAVFSDFQQFFCIFYRSFLVCILYFSMSSVEDIVRATLQANVNAAGNVEMSQQHADELQERILSAIRDVQISTPQQQQQQSVPPLPEGTPFQNVPDGTLNVHEAVAATHP